MFDWLYTLFGVKSRPSSQRNYSYQPSPAVKARPSKREIWQKISALRIGEIGSPKTIASRLREELGWKEEFCDSAIEEYKRFLFLMVISDKTVTPSLTVDEVWHLHLQYTKAYWEDLCAGILGVALHHNPSDGSAEDTARYEKAYLDTLSLYQRTFGQNPPAAIWGREVESLGEPKDLSSAVALGVIPAAALASQSDPKRRESGSSDSLLSSVAGCGGVAAGDAGGGCSDAGGGCADGGGASGCGSSGCGGGGCGGGGCGGGGCGS